MRYVDREQQQRHEEIRARMLAKSAAPASALITAESVPHDLPELQQLRQAAAIRCPSLYALATMGGVFLRLPCASVLIYACALAACVTKSAVLRLRW